MFDRILVWKWLRGSGKRRAAVRKPPRPRLALEALDERILLSVTEPLPDGTEIEHVVTPHRDMNDVSLGQWDPAGRGSGGLRGTMAGEGMG